MTPRAAVVLNDAIVALDELISELGVAEDGELLDVAIAAHGDLQEYLPEGS
jgi:hypothetical protein